LYVEQVRGVADQHDMDNIARGQARLEDDGLLAANHVLICDTDLLATLIWNQRYFKHYPDWMNNLYEARRSHLYLLCDLDLPWIDDGYRDSGSDARRRWFHQRFLEEFEARGLKYVLVQGETEQRFAAALQALQVHFPQAVAASLSLVT
jgi:nicotinamide riboside kinase